MRPRISTVSVGMAAAVLLLVLAAGQYGSGLTPPTALAQSAGSGLSGFAWSENIGWIQMFNAAIGSDGQTLTGYAWSENIGWVSFNQSDLSGCPSGTCSARMTGGALAGWARACAGTVNGDCTGSARSDGWDGWISLSGSGYGPALPSGQTVGFLSGYAWGSDIVGWIDFSQVAVAGPVGPNGSVTLTANPTRVRPNNSTTLSWTVSGMVGCGITASSGPAPAPYSTANGTDGAHAVSATIISQTVFTLTCSNGSATSTGTATVGILPTFIEI